MNHPAMKTVAPVRKALGVRTAFNLLGPLTNAARAQHVVIGEADGRMGSRGDGPMCHWPRRGARLRETFPQTLTCLPFLPYPLTLPYLGVFDEQLVDLMANTLMEVSVYIGLHAHMGT